MHRRTVSPCRTMWMNAGTPEEEHGPLSIALWPAQARTDRGLPSRGAMDQQPRTQLALDGLHVAPDRALGQLKGTGDPRDAGAVVQQDEDGHFAGRQPEQPGRVGT